MDYFLVNLKDIEMILLSTSHSYSLSKLIVKVFEAKLKINDNFINYSGVGNPIYRMLLQLQKLVTQHITHIISNKCTNLEFQ